MFYLKLLLGLLFFNIKLLLLYFIVVIILIIILSLVLDYVLSYKPSFTKPFSSLGKKVSNSNLFGVLNSFASSGNLFSVLKKSISGSNDKSYSNNPKQKMDTIAQKDISNLSMLASNRIKSYNNVIDNEHNKAGKKSPTSITFTNEELEEISNFNNKLNIYNHSPAHEFEILTAGISDNSQSLQVVGFLDYDPLQAASANHNKKSTKKNFFMDFNLKNSENTWN